jgi:arabinoxylan arabinofuranohydrolase
MLLYLKKSTIAIIAGVIITLVPKIDAAESFSAYLFAYFTGNDKSQETICFALSDDGYNYKAINKGKPVVSSAAISSTGGVRDPHILRGENNDYYMVATDMVSANGWASNRAMVLLRSTNLTDWTSSVVNIPQTYSAFAAADRVWAPQTIFDPSVGKYMVYFSMRLGSTDVDKIYYAYVNNTFTALESAPKVLFTNNGFLQ